MPEPPVGAGDGISVPQRIWYGLLGGAVYRQIAEGTAGVYPAFLAVAVTAALALAIVLASSAARGLDAVGQAIALLPDFTISGGALVLPPGAGTAPVRVTAAGAVAVLAPQVQPGLDPLGNARYGLLITDQELVVRPGGGLGGDRPIPLSAFGDLTVNRPDLVTLIRRLAGAGVWIYAAASVVYAVGRDLVRGAIIGWIGLTCARGIGRSGTWPQAWRIGLAAWTLPLLAEVAQVAVPVPGWALWAVACVYAVTGCFHLPREA